MAKHELSLPVMALGAFAVFAIAATVLYLGASPHRGDPPAASLPSMDAYRQLIQRNAMTADSWADYADALASMPGGSLGGEAELAIQRALSLNPNHPKALWLEASHAYEEQRYADALILWKRLRAALRDDSPDAGIVDANIAESAQLAGTPRG